MFFSLKYGTGDVSLEIPDMIETEVINPPSVPAVPNLRGAIVSALDKPIGSPPLKEIIPSSGKVAVVVSDKTRPCAYPKVLPLLLDYLNANGVPDSRIFLLVAYGAHRQHTEDENAVFYGREVVRRVEVFHHDCRDESGLVHVGTTSRGTQVSLNKRYIGAAMSMVAASVSFHYFAGFGGGRKVIFPGLGPEKGILNNHRIFVECAGESLEKMRSFEANVETNPLHDDLMEAVTMAPPSFVLNFCLSREGDISGIFAGHWRESHLLACRFLRETLVSPKRKYDLVIATCGGNPKDINFIQSHKTIDNAFGFVKPGGTMLVLARCDDGIGSPSFLSWFEHAGAKEMRKALLENYSMNGGTALALKMKADACRIWLYSSLDENAVKKTGLHPIRNLRQDLREMIERLGVRSAAVLPEGAITVAGRESGMPREH